MGLKDNVEQINYKILCGELELVRGFVIKDTKITSSECFGWKSGLRKTTPLENIYLKPKQLVCLEYLFKGLGVITVLLSTGIYAVLVAGKNYKKDLAKEKLKKCDFMLFMVMLCYLYF